MDYLTFLSLSAHKLILAASSTYFYEVFGKVTSTGMLKLWLPPPISRAAMSVILDWMYGVDVHGALLVEDVGPCIKWSGVFVVA